MSILLDRKLRTLQTCEIIATGAVVGELNPLTPKANIAGYRLTWASAGGAFPDYHTFTAVSGGQAIDLGDYDGNSLGVNAIYIAGQVDSIMCHTAIALPGSDYEVTFHVEEVTTLPEVQSLQRIRNIYTATASPIVIDSPNGAASSRHEYEFSLVGTWTAGTIQPIEYEPGGWQTDFGAQAADYRSPRRIGPVFTVELTLAALNTNLIQYVATHMCPV